MPRGIYTLTTVHSNNFTDLTGKVFGRLLVLASAGTTKGGNVRWNCQCTCGDFTTVAGRCLNSGNTQSCGCLLREALHLRLINLSGKTFGRLTVLEHKGPNKRGKNRWVCRCKCGTLIAVVGSNLKSGNTRSCGCLAAEVQAEIGRKSFTHGKARHGSMSTAYSPWGGMKQRCTNPNSPKWEHYGGATPPVRVCKRWTGPKGFENFLADMGPRPAGTSLSRLADTGDYKPRNVVWGSQAHQAEQKRLKTQQRKGIR